MEVLKIKKDPQLVVSILKEVSNAELFHWIGEGFMRLADHIEQQHGHINGLPFVSFKKLDDSGNVTATPITLEIGIPIDREVQDTEDILCYQKAGYQALQGTFVGNDEDLPLVYSLMIEEIKKTGHQFLHESYEYYLTDASATPDTQTTLVEIPYH